MADENTAFAHSLQQRLLIELLKRNISHAARPHFTDSHETISGPGDVDGLLAACDKVNDAISSLTALSSRLRTATATANTGYSKAHVQHQIHVFLSRIERLREHLKDLKYPSPPEKVLRNVKGNLESMLASIVGERRRAERISEEYVGRLAVCSVQRQDTYNAVKDLSKQISHTKEFLMMANRCSNGSENRGSGSNGGGAEPGKFGGTLLDEYLAVCDCVSNNLRALHNTVTWFGESAYENRPRMGGNDVISRLSAGITRHKKRYHLLARKNRELIEEYGLLQKEHGMVKEAYNKQSEEIGRLTAELEAAKSHEQATPPTSAAKRKRPNGVMVAFSGFTLPIPNSTNPTALQHLTAVIEKCGGRVHTSSDFPSTLTHIVTPCSRYRSVRTMAAALSSKWIVSVEWLEECERHGRFIPEAPFGRLHKQGAAAIRSKAFHFTTAFVKQQQQAKSVLNAVSCRTLIEGIGKGRCVDGESGADYVICGDGEERQGRNWLRLKDFLLLVPGHSDFLLNQPQ